MTNRRRITAALCIATALVTFMLTSGVADATTVRPVVAVVADDSCGQTATLTIYNQAWWFGLDEDAEVVTSTEPTIVPMGTQISITEPFTTTFALTHDVVIELGVRFPHEPDKVTDYLIPLDFSEDCVPVTTTTSTTAEPTTTTAAPTAPPAPVVSTTPVVTG